MAKKRNSYTHIPQTDLNKGTILPHLVHIFFKGNKMLHCEVIFVTLVDHISHPFSWPRGKHYFEIDMYLSRMCFCTTYYVVSAWKYMCVCMCASHQTSIYLSVYKSSLSSTYPLAHLSIHPSYDVCILQLTFFPISQY